MKTISHKHEKNIRTINVNEISDRTQSGMDSSIRRKRNQMEGRTLFLLCPICFPRLYHIMAPVLNSPIMIDIIEFCDLFLTTTETSQNEEDEIYLQFKLLEEFCRRIRKHMFVSAVEMTGSGKNIEQKRFPNYLNYNCQKISNEKIKFHKVSNKLLEKE